MENPETKVSPNFIESPVQKLMAVGFFFFLALLIGLGNVGLFAILFFFMFPSGLTIVLQSVGFCSYGGAAPTCGALEETMVFGGWLIYLGLVIPIVLSRRRRLVVLLFIIFVLLILPNILGCQAVTRNACTPYCG